MQGIQALFEFQCSNTSPAAASLVEEHINRTGSYFRGYIKRGVEGLAYKKQQEEAAQSRAVGDEYKMKLEKLQSMFEKKEEVAEVKSSRHTMLPLPTHATRRALPHPIAKIAEPSLSAVTVGMTQRSKSVADLKERLARMKVNLG